MAFTSDTDAKAVATAATPNSGTKAAAAADVKETSDAIARLVCS